MQFVECDNGVTDSAIPEKIPGFIESSGLDGSKLHGQAYDGASNLAGKMNGAAALTSAQ